MKKIIYSLVLMFIFFSISHAQNVLFHYGEIYLGMRQAELMKFLIDKNFIEIKGTIIIGNYLEAAIMIDLDKDNIISDITIKKDIVDSITVFDNQVKEFIPIYGKPILVDKSKMIAEFSKENKISLVSVKKSSSGSSLLFILFSNSKDSKRYKNLISDN